MSWVLCGLLLAASPARAAQTRRPTMSDADAKFQKGLYQEALGDYEALAKSARGEEQVKAQFRACEAEALLFRYGEAIGRFEKIVLPKKGPDRARLLLLKAELYREYLKQYGFGLRGDVVEGEGSAFRKTPKELRREAEAAYRELWDMRAELARMPIAGESYFLDVAKADRSLYPTVLDMLLERWTGYLLSEAEEDEAARPRPAADAFVVASYPGKYSPDSSLAEQAAAAMEEGGRGSGERAEAAEHWRLGRLLLPLRHPERVAPAKDAQALSRKAEGILRRWMKDFRAPSSRAEAGFEAASLLNERGEWEAAVGLCDEVSAAEPRTLGAKKCARLAASIKTPTLGATGRATPPPGRKALTVSARNVRQLHLRLYPMTPERLRGLNRAVNDWTWSGALNRVEPDVLRRLLASQTPAKEWSIPVRPAAPHAPTSVDVDLPAGTAAGIYVVVACADAAFEPGSSLLSGAALNVTDLVLIGTTGLEGDERSFLYDEQGPRERTANAFHFYLLDGVTGKPAPGLPIEVRQAENWHWTDAHLETDETGRAQLPITVRLVPNVYNNHQADPLAGRDGRWAYWASPAGMSFVIPAPVELFVETDRPIYRPGQKVRYKATVVRRTPRGLEAYPGPTAVKVSARDANGQEFFSESKVPDANGGLDGELAIPAGRLLGSYQLYAQLPYAGGTFTGNGRFSVEEYKRPEFEVSVDEAEGAWRFGREATVRGSVKYFFGGPVPDAAVTYTVRRQVWRPWFCWWWSWRPADESAAEIARGTLRAGKDGKFSFAFTPKPADASEPDPLPARFIVSVSARDAGGRTLAAERAFTAGKSAYLFQLKPSAGFAAAGAPFSVTAKLVTLSEAPAEGKGGFQLRRLDQAPPPQPEAPDWSGGLMESPSLEQLYQSVPDGPLEREGKLAYAKGPGATIDLSGLKPGAYRLILKADDPWGGKVEQAIVLVAADLKAKSPLKLPSLSLPERTEYLAGETARILLGSADLSELIHVEVWGGRTLLSRAALPGAGLRVFSLPLAAVHKGGITVRWFGVQDFKLRSGSAAIAVPWRDKELKVSLAHDKALLPGQKVSWTLHAKDWRGRPVAGSALARVYDRSLEYYAKDSGPSPAALYQARSGPDQARGSLQAFFATQCEIDRGWIAAMIRLFQEAIGEPMPPGLRLNRGRVYGFQGGVMSRALGGAMAAGALEEAAPAPMAMAKNEAMDFKASDKLSEPGGGAQRAAAAPPPAEPKARSDFSETAYFGPRLPVVGGAARLEFAMPEQLTGWRIAGTVLTPDIKVGSFSEETATRKELMVRVELPRFLREGDEGTIKAVVHNESEAPLSGSLTLSAEEEEKPATERLGLSQLERSFSVAPHALAAFSWKLKAPRGTTRFKLRAVARAGEDVDAEERDLPILPSRQRLIESVVAALNGDSSKVLALKSLAAADPTRVSELAQVQVDPQLALTILNSLPYLVRYPYECVEQTLDRYVPLAVVHRVYERHPAIAAAAAKLPKRSTLTPAWEKDDPKRLVDLMETPWLELSRGRKTSLPIVDLFDTDLVARQKEDALAKLKAAQNPDGGFPWFAGGRSDPYITLLVLAGFSETQHYGVEAPAQLVGRAVRYELGELPRRLKPDQGELSLILYAAYVLTSFPEALSAKVPELAGARTLVKAWLDYADVHADAMTQLGKACAAWAYRRLGEKARSERYLDRAMDGAREEEGVGVYWQPEKLSWLWYNDSVETHAFVLRTLQNLRPKDPRIPGLVQWLVFSRKGTEWKSTKASAAAVFTLLDFMKARGALDKGDAFAVDWGSQHESATVGPEDWLATPLRWTRRAGEIGPDAARVKISKKGPGLAFVSATHVYTTETPAEESAPGLLRVHRLFFKRVKEGEDYRLKPLKSGEAVRVGDQVEVQLRIEAKSQFEYMHLKDPKAAGFEAETLTSGWVWDQLGRYEEPRDSLTNFFVSWLPHGEYVLRYRLRPTVAGRFRIGAATLQSMYAPEFAANSAGFELAVEE